MKELSGKWILKSNKKTKILDNNNKEMKTIEIQENSINRIKKDDTIALIFTEPLTDDRLTYTKKHVNGEARNYNW